MIGRRPGRAHDVLALALRAGGGVALLVSTAAPAAATSCIPTPLALLARQSPAIVEATVQAIAAPVVDRPPLPPGTPPPPPDFSPIVVASLVDVQPLKGARVDRLTASPGMLRAGQRYLFVTHASGAPGRVGIGACGGMARPIAYAAELRRWLVSLEAGGAGRRVVGAALLRRWEDPAGAAHQAIDGARVVLRGPVSRETITDAQGEYAFLDLPEGDYTLAVQPPSGPMVADAPFVLRASLEGASAAAVVDGFVAVNGVVSGRVIDERRQPVANATVYLHVAPSVGASEDHGFAFARTDARGAYVFRHVPPGRYVATLDEAYLPAYAAFPATGDHEIVVGWADEITLAPLEAVTVEETFVDGLVVDSQGHAVEIGVRVEIVGTLGVYPKSRTDDSTNETGRFTLLFVPGLRYRFTFRTAVGPPHVVERVVLGDELRFVLP